MTNIVTQSYPVLQWFRYDIDKMPMWDEPGDWDMQASIRMVENEGSEGSCEFKFYHRDENGEIIGFEFARETGETETYTLDLDEDPIYRIDGEAPWEDDIPF